MQLRLASVAARWRGFVISAWFCDSFVTRGGAVLTIFRVFNEIPMKTVCPRPRVFLSTLLAAALALPLLGARDERSFADMSMEELMNESVRSVAKKEQRLADVASAVTVLWPDDLRRSGATSLGEALRLVPGLDVASYNSREWAISARGSNNVYANKLLVMVDGRSVYSPLFAGVYWDLQQVIMEDVERIEVIRGPGATVWGANAVNGVINVTTASARETQGGLLTAQHGSAAKSAGAFRFGGQLAGGTFYRVYASRVEGDEHRLPDGRGAGDRWLATHGGVRIDAYPRTSDQLTWQADATRSELRDGTADTLNLNTVARWIRQLTPDSRLQAQFYFDHDYHNELARAKSTIDTADLAAHHTFSIGEHHEVTWGGGFRTFTGTLDPLNAFAQIRDRDFTLRLLSGFAQDEVKLVPGKLSLTLGTKVEHNDLTGLEVQPSARMVFRPSARQSVWAAVSRAVRTPDIVEGTNAVAILYGEPFAGPGGLYVPTLVGNPSLHSGALWAFEAGYRAQLSKQVSIDLAVFHNEYRNLIDYGVVTRLVPGKPVGIAEIPWINGLHGHSNGAEFALNCAITSRWRLGASYTWFQERTQSSRPKAQDVVTAVADPTHQAVLRSSWDLSKHLSLDAQFRGVSRINDVPAYVSADVRLAYRVNENLELSVMGKDLLDPQHPEQPPLGFAARTEVPRTIAAKIAWRY
jgi:iron complex outermembrane receptor protein